MTRAARRTFGTAILGALCACSRPTPTTSSSAPAAAASSSAPVAAASIAPAAPSSSSAAALVRARPYLFVAPPSDAPRGLVVVLHGYGGSGAGHLGYFGLARAAAERGLMIAAPDGTPDHKGMRFWNATDACCDFDGRGPDDVAYLDAIVDDVARAHALDPRRVYAIGHSNGGFMAMRWACDRPARVAAVVSLAGAAAAEARCAPGASVLQIHGDKDELIRIEGGRSFGSGKPYPSARASAGGFAARAGCADALEAAGDALDLDTSIAGAETRRERFAQCPAPAGLAFELWTVRGAGHLPTLGPSFADATLSFLAAHARP